MYFKSRVEAGQKLAQKISEIYQGKGCTVVALSDGGVMVGAQIALKLNCPLTMLVSDTIELPRENTALASISQSGVVTFNPVYSDGQLDEINGEYRGYIEQAKMTKMREMHRDNGNSNLIRKDLLRGRVVIVVSDGLSDSLPLETAAEYLKPIQVRELVIATPLATIPVVDRMHVLGDRIFCLSVIDNYIKTEHYYDAHDVPTHDLAVKTVEQIIQHWK